MIEIYLFVDNQWQKLEILADIDIKVTYQIFDVDELFKKQGDYTIDFQIVGSKINNKIFQHAYNISSFNSFKLSSPTPVRIYKNGVEMLIGQLELLKINILEKQVEYQCVAYSNIRSFINTLGDQYLVGNNNEGDYAGRGYIESGYTQLNENDIEVSGSHYLYLDKIVNSWTASTLSYIYPLIDDGSFSNGTGLTFKANHFTPALFVKPIFDKIVYNAGFTYTSEFLNSDLFSRIVMTSGIKQFEPNEVTSEKFKVTSNVLDAGYSIFPGISGTSLPEDNFTSDYLQDTVDFKTTTEMYVAEGTAVNRRFFDKFKPVALYAYKTDFQDVDIITDASGNTYTKFTVNKTGKYDVKTALGIDNVYLYSNEWNTGTTLTWTKYPTWPQFKFILRQYSSAGAVKQFWPLRSNAIANSYVYEISNFTPYGDVESYFSDSRRLFAFGDYIPKQYLFLGSAAVSEGPVTISCIAGDYFQVEMSILDTQYVTNQELGLAPQLARAGAPTAEFIDITWKFKISIDSSFELTLPDQQGSDLLCEGDWVDLQNCLPAKTKKSDFIKSIFQMFNLYILDDPNLENNLIIEPRDVIQSSGKIIDWSDKLDTSKDISIERVSDILEKKLIFTYKEGIDDACISYQNKYNVGYGGYEREEKYYTVGDGKIEETKLIFSPSVITSQNVTTNGTKYINTLEMKNIEYDNTAVPPTSKTIYNLHPPKLLFWNGFSPIENIGRTMFRIFSDYDGQFHDYGRWPDFNHIDNTTGKESTDLCFYYNYAYYQNLTGRTADNSGIITNGNLYNKYYSKVIAEYEDEDAKKVTAYFYLNESDRYQLNLFDIIQVAHPGETTLHYRISKIENFDAVNSTKVELLKYNDLNIYSQSPQKINGLKTLNSGNNFAGLTNYLTGISYDIVTISANTDILFTDMSSVTYDTDRLLYLSAITFTDSPSATYTFNQNVNVSTLYCDYINRSGLTFSFPGGGKFPEGTGSTYIGFYGHAPAAKPTALTGSLTTVTAVVGTAYTWNATDDGGNVGFLDVEEFNTMCCVVQNLQTRVDELESRLKNIGLLS